MIPDSIQPRAILKPYIKEGRVDYHKLRGHEKLAELVQYIEVADVDEMSRDEELAFWMNAYNILTLKAVLEKLENNPHWKGVTSLWKRFKFFFWNKHRVAGEKMSLYTLENSILRDEFDDPRIHFAINCASESCPYLPDELFDSEGLDDYLDELTQSFINEQNGAVLDNNTLYLSEIFERYSKDFGGKDNLVDYVRQYWEGDPLPDDVQIEFQDYDWKLNSL